MMFYQEKEKSAGVMSNGGNDREVIRRVKKILLESNMRTKSNS